MSTSAATTAKPALKSFRSPGTVIARFVARRTLRSAVLWAYVFGAYMASKSIGFTKAYPTHESRLKIAHTLGNNIGLNALLGTPHHVDTAGGYANWNCLGVLTMMGSIWAFLLATKYFRGEEDAGRSEILLSGQTTQARAALNTLAGLGTSLLILFLVVAIMFVGIGKINTLNFSTSSSLYFALCSVAGAALFMSVGAFASQLMPTRAKASSLAAGLFGAFFLIRAMADVTSLHWLLNITPLGWIEKLQPLVGSQPVWLLPIFGSVVVLSGLTIWLAGRRDLGSSTFADNTSARAKTALLRTPFTAALRLTRAASIGWLLAIGFAAAFYGVLTKAAVQAFSTAGSAHSAHKALSKLEHSSQANFGTLYLGVVFLILMSLTMSYVASAIGKVREDEAEGYVDNFLVRPVSRTQWLGGRILLIALISLIASMLASLGAWAGQASQHTGVSFNSIALAGINMMAPVLFTLGAGVLAFGIRPRFTTIVAYGVIGWSFLISMISSGVNLNHWILDTSVLHQIALAPATSPNWTTDLIMVGLGLVLCVGGAAAFTRRDLQTE